MCRPGPEEKARAPGQREQAKGKEAVDALAETSNHEGPFGVARTDVFGLNRETDTVGLDEVGEDLLVPPFLETVEFDRLPQQGVGDGRGIAQHAQAGLALGLNRDVPDWQADQSVARLGIEDRPVDDRGLVAVVSVEQHSAKCRFMSIAAGNDRSGMGGSPISGGMIGSFDRRVIHHRRHLGSWSSPA